jgi:RNA polymerase sigma-70 factor (ECF subfamily)
MTVSTCDSDMALLSRFRDERDADAFGEIVRRYAGAVYATCHRILHDPGRSEDATQETFYRLMTKPQRVESSLGGWLHRAATRQALDIRRSETARHRREAAYEAMPSVEATTWAEVVPQLDASIAKLPEEFRDLLVRHFLRGQSQAELAAELGTSPATLSRRMKQALEALRTELAASGVAVALMVLFKLLSINGRATVSPALKLALGKMSLFCNARTGVVRPISLAHRIASVPHAVYGVRWSIAAAFFSVGVCVLGLMLARQMDLHRVMQSSHPVTDKVQVARQL